MTLVGRLMLHVPSNNRFLHGIESTCRVYRYLQLPAKQHRHLSLASSQYAMSLSLARCSDIIAALQDMPESINCATSWDIPTLWELLDNATSAL